MAKLDELHNYAKPDNYLDELHRYDKAIGNTGSYDEIHNYGNRGLTYGIDEMHLYGSYQTVETSEDEVNKPKERELIDIDEYFDEIEYLDEEQKEERKDLANEFRDILMLLFMLMLGDLRAGNEINEGFYLSLGKSRFMDAVDRLMPSITIDIYTQIENYIHQNLTYVIESTVRNQGDSYFFTEIRATAIAVDDSMASYNLDELEEAIKAGYTHKIWKSMEDNKVRKTHQAVDGKKVEIRKPFHVGRCLMQAPMIFDENSPFQDAKEIINCRCCLIYSNSKNDKKVDIEKNIERNKDISRNSLIKGDYPVTDEQINEILNNELSGVHFSAVPKYNSRISSQGKTVISELFRGGTRKVKSMEIGKQVIDSKENLIDSLLHEELEARIGVRAVHSKFYGNLDKMSDDDRHAYINRVIETMFRLKGWDYGLVRH